jgi:HPt (histidine-containing phosphotransfer) domain-containing protein
VQVSDPSLVLDLHHLKDITLDDDDLMREVVSALIDDTSRQQSMLDAAIREHDRALHEVGALQQRRLRECRGESRSGKAEAART